MRRRRQDIDGVPARLAVFTPSDWPGGTWQDCYRLWRAAQDAHAEAHGWPGGAFDLFMRRVLVRQRYESRPLHRGVTAYFGLPPERVNWKE